MPMQDSERSETLRGLQALRVVDDIARLSRNEGAAVLQLKIMLLAGHLAEHLGTPKIHRYKFEFPVAGGRADLALFHLDGGVSLVEAKAGCDIRSVASGIGQLFIYAAGIEDKFVGGKRPPYVAKILCAPADHDPSRAAVRACLAAGVRLVPLAPFESVKDALAIARTGQ